MKYLVPALLALSLAACSSMGPEAKVRSALVNAGLPPHIAGCMAERMVDRLSMDELRQLKSLSKVGNRDVGAMSIDELLFRVRALEDPHILKVVTRAGLGCAIAG